MRANSAAISLTAVGMRMRMRERCGPAVVLVGALLAVLGTGCGSETIVEAPTATSSVNAMPTNVAVATSEPQTSLVAQPTDVGSGSTIVAAPSSTGNGPILGITFAPTRPLSGTEQSAASTRLQGRATALGYNAEVSMSSNGQLMVAITGVSQADGDTIAANLTAITGNISLRPVLIDDQFGLPCVPGAASQPAAGATVGSLPAIALDSSGYVASLGGGLCKLGPAGGTGQVFAADAKALLVTSEPDGWGVTVSLKPGPTGEALWNALASDCYNATATCPTRQLAIELDGLIISAPTVQQPEFSGTVQITGAFTETQATALADVLNSGAFDYQLTVVGTQYITP
jgi:hypothetical protein